VTQEIDEPGGRAETAGRAGQAKGPSRGLLDTSVFIALETGRPIHGNLLPEESAIYCACTSPNPGGD
jgi:hypothetical protein